MKKTKYSKSGFTILELLVAMGITAGIVVLLTSVIRTALDTYRSGASEMRAVRQGKSALEDLTRDLQGIVIKPEKNINWFEVRVLGDLAAGLGGSSVELAFFTNATDRYDGGVDLGGDVCAVRYRIAYDDMLGKEIGSGDGNRTFNFFRQRIDPDETFERVLASSAGGAGISRDAGDTIFSVLDGVGSEVEDVENFLAENIYEFSLTLEIADPSAAGGVRTEVYSAGADSSLRLYGNKVFEGGNEIQNARILSVGVGLTVISDQAMDLFRATNIRPTAENLHSYSSRVSIN